MADKVFAAEVIATPVRLESAGRATMLLKE